MRSTEFIQVAREIVKKDRALFEELMEYEKTKKVRTKERLNFTIDKNVADRFKRHCRRNGYNMSAKIEKAMDEIVKEV
jgi:hypothetical protein